MKNEMYNSKNIDNETNLSKKIYLQYLFSLAKIALGIEHEV